MAENRSPVPAAGERRRNHLLWIGPLVTLTGVLSYFIYFARFPALRDVPWLNLPIAGFGLFLAALGVWRAVRVSNRLDGKVLGSLGLFVTLALVLLFGYYVFSLSYQLPSPTATTLSIEMAPDFTLPAHDGNSITLSALRGSKIVLVFYRGHW